MSNWVFNKPSESLKGHYVKGDTVHQARLCYYSNEACIRVLTESETQYIPESGWDQPIYGIDDAFWQEIKNDYNSYNGDITVLLFG